MLIIKKKNFQKMTNNYKKKCTPELRQLRTQKMKLSTNHQPFFRTKESIYTTI